MKRNSLGVNLLKGEQNPKPRFGGDPRFTDIFLDKIENEDKEGKVPQEGDQLIYYYNDRYHHLHSKYTINRDGEVKSLKGEVMKYFFHPNKRGPRVRLQVRRLNKDGKIVFLEKEIGILQMMERTFGLYFPGYKLKKASPRAYILVPKDGNYNNMRYDNLHYVRKDENTKKNLMKQYIKSHPNIDDEMVAVIFRTSQSYVRKSRQELVDEGHSSRFSEYQRFQKEIGIEFSEDSFEIYKLLIHSKGQLSNLEIAKILRPKELSENTNQRFFTDKIVRARKKLTDKGLISRFNGNFKSVRDEVIERIRNKANSGETSQQIADAFGLKKQQVDNLTRQMRKEDARKGNH